MSAFRPLLNFPAAFIVYEKKIHWWLTVELLSVIIEIFPLILDIVCYTVNAMCDMRKYFFFSCSLLLSWGIFSSSQKCNQRWWQTRKWKMRFIVRGNNDERLLGLSRFVINVRLSASELFEMRNYFWNSEKPSKWAFSCRWHLILCNSSSCFIQFLWVHINKFSSS